MPRYSIETDQGKFTMTLDRAPDSREQLQELAEEHIGSLVERPPIPGPAAGLTPRVTGQDVRTALEIGGAIAGSEIMPQLGPAAGRAVSRIATGAMNLLSRTAGAGAGAAAGSLVAEPLSPTERPLKTAAESALAAGIGEVAGAPLRTGVSRLREGSRTITPRGAEARQVLQGRVLPGEATSSFSQDIMQNVSEFSLTGGGTITKFRQGREVLIKTLADDAAIVAGRRATMEDAGKAFLSRLEDRMDLWNSRVRQLYGVVDDLAKWPVQQPLPKGATPNARFLLRKLESGAYETTVGVNTESLKVFARQEMDRLGATPGSLASGRMGILKDIVDGPEIATFAQAHELRSSLLKRQRSLLAPDDKQAAALTKQLSKRVDEAMQGAATESGLPELMTAYRKAASVMKTGAERFYDEFAQKYAEMVPEKIVASLAKPRNSTEISKVFAAINPQSAAANDLRSAFIQRIIDKAYDPKTELIRGAVIQNELKALGPETTKAFLPPATRESLEQFGRVVTTVQEKQGQGIGRMFIQLKQAGALTQLGGATFFAGAGDPVASIAILGVPWFLSHLLTSPRATRIMLDGLRVLPRGTQAVPTAITKAISIIVKEGAVERQQKRKQIIRSGE